MSKKEELKFIEKTHKYFLGKTELVSVTTFISKFFKKFDAKAIARKLAKFPINKQNKKGVRYWLKTWKNDAQHGTDTHWLIEQAMVGNTGVNTSIFEERTLKKAQLGIDWIHNKMRSYGEPQIAAEGRLFDKELGIAGTIDLLISHNKEDSSTDRVISLIDWKTNKKITKSGYGGEKAKAPIETFNDCNYIKYALQLSLYAYIIERQGQEIQDLIIVHLTEKGAVEYKIPYLKEEIKKMLEVKE